MQPTLIRSAQYGLESNGAFGVHQWRQRVDYKKFKSAYGPDYKTGPHLYGVNMAKATRIGVLAAGFGVAAGIFGIFFLDSVPRLQRDVLQKVPIIGKFYTHEIAPEDNPF